MKTLKEKIQQLNSTYDSIGIITKWMKTERGRKFASKLGYERLTELEKRFKAPKIRINNYIQRLNVYKHAANSCRYPTKHNLKPIRGYEKLIVDKQASGALKPPKNLSKEEIQAIHTTIIRDKNGNPIQKSDSSGKKFWNAVTNKPIYKRKRRSTTLGLAAKCYGYELHKIAKWDKKHPFPEASLCNELFPDVVLAEYKTRRNIALKTIRDFLAVKYCGSVRKTIPLRAYSVHKRTGYNGKEIIFETECDPYVYGYGFMGNNWLPLHEIQLKLATIAKYKADNTIIGFKVYDMYGNIRGSIAA